MSSQGFSIKELIKIFKVSRKTIFNWLTRWEDQGILGLYNQRGRGRKPKSNLSQTKEVKEWVKSEPKALNRIKHKIQKNWEINISKDTIKRIIKNLGMRWKRMKRGMKKSSDGWELEVKLPRLEVLKNQEKKGEIDLRYLDESGFSLKPYILYGWQETGKTITCKSCHSKQVNVLGLMNRKNELYYEIIKGYINSEVVINFLDKFSHNLSKKNCSNYGQSFNSYKRSHSK